MGSYEGVDGFWLFSVQHPGTPSATELLNDQGWTPTDTGDQAGGSGPAGAIWSGAQNDVPMPIVPGQVANYSYVTPIVPIGLVTALIGTGDLAALFTVLTLGAPTTTSALSGPQAVPGNSIYEYDATFPSTPEASMTLGSGLTNFVKAKDDTNPASPWEVGAPATAVAKPIDKGWIYDQTDKTKVVGEWVKIQFTNTPAAVQVSLEGLKDASGLVAVAPMIPVYMVQVQVQDPEPPTQAFSAPGTITKTVENGVLTINNQKNVPVTPGVGVLSGDLKAMPRVHGLDWAAKVTLTGPSARGVVNLGVASINVGFVQHAQTTVSMAYTQEETYLTNSAATGQWMLDLSPGSRSSPWYATERNLLGPSLLRGVSGTIYANDTPGTAFPIKVQIGDTTYITSSINEIDNFQLDVAATTTDATAYDKGVVVTNPVWAEYNAVGGANGASWSFQFGGSVEFSTITNSYILSLGDSPGVIPPTSWQAVAGPRPEAVTGITTKQAADDSSWNDHDHS